jgi:hypothetical protein
MTYIARTVSYERKTFMELNTSQPQRDKCFRGRARTTFNHFLNTFHYSFYGDVTKWVQNNVFFLFSLFRVIFCTHQV